jgi:hypothetical protein
MILSELLKDIESAKPILGQFEAQQNIILWLCISCDVHGATDKMISRDKTMMAEIKKSIKYDEKIRALMKDKDAPHS